MSVEQPLPLARAIAVRNFDEQHRTQRRMAELTGEQYQPLNPLIREGMILAGTRMNERILAEPRALPINVQELTSTVFENLGDDVFDEIVHDMQKDDPESLPITGSQLRSLSIATTNSAITAMVPASMIESGFGRMLRQVNVAKELSAEKGVEPSTVYADNELYEELMRRSYSPREFAKMGLDVTRQFTPDKMAEMVMRTIPAIAQSMDEVMGDEPLMTPDDIQEMRQEMAEDPEFKKMVRTTTLQFKRAFRTLTGEQIVRLWGEEGLQSLPNTVRTTLVGSSKNFSVIP